MPHSEMRGNLIAIARKDLAESRLVAGKNPDVIYCRGYYKLFSFLRIAAFAVSAFFLSILLISYLYQLGGDSISDTARSAYSVTFNNVLLPFVLFVVGFSFTCPKCDSAVKSVINAVGVCLAVTSGVWLCFYVHSLMSQATNYYDGGSTKYLLRHLIPIALFAVITVALFILKLLEHIAFTKRYNEVSREAYDRFLESRADGGYSDSEWREYIENYSREARPFPLKRSLKNKRRKQQEETEQ